MGDSLIRSISGVRGVVGKSLLPNVIINHICAFAKLLESKHYNQKQKRIVVGRDSRVSGPWVEMLVNGSLIASGYEVIHIGIASTPTVQFMVQQTQASGGIVITSSHNPIQWNGLKFVGPDGLFIEPKSCDILFSYADYPNGFDFSSYSHQGSITTKEVANTLHIEKILSLPFIDVAKIKSKQYTVALDSVNGAGGPIMTALLGQLGCKIIGLNLEPTGVFAHTPEPVPANLGQLCELVKKEKADFGIAVDPDVDRCVLIDETGTPVGEEYTLAFAVELLLGDCGRKGYVCKNLSSSRVVDDICKKYGSQVVCTPVGEIQVAKKMEELKAIIGGEGNGGVMLPDIHIGRDAPVAAALILQLFANRGFKKMSELKASLPQYEIVKLKAGIEGLDPDRILQDYKTQYRGKEGVEINEEDGLKIDAPEWWVHLRKSNTEHIIRVISESKTVEQATEIAQKFIDEIESKRSK
ncbi:hypothetical protein CYY_002662 [Polysphondylium violaceum]|uniref:Phosphoglucosamine mutase n=1 Tax=Polysphondylium violaceum TaxID=133409 RepID=A0A8J4V237_9MYCE|nr:hypothetical protein CYY_002662 [Polysphondylium violaceum]